MKGLLNGLAVLLLGLACGACSSDSDTDGTQISYKGYTYSDNTPIGSNGTVNISGGQSFSGGQTPEIPDVAIGAGSADVIAYDFALSTTDVDLTFGLFTLTGTVTLENTGGTEVTVFFGIFATQSATLTETNSVLIDDFTLFRATLPADSGPFVYSFTNTTTTATIVWPDDTTLHPTATSEDWNVAVIVDHDGLISEQNESNNISNQVTVTVTQN